MKNLLFIFLLGLPSLAFCQKVTVPTTQGELKVTPISHATMVWEWNDLTFFFDPTGGAKPFYGFRAPNLVFITDVHGDHLNMESLKALDLSQTTIVAPAAVADRLRELNTGEILSLENGKEVQVLGVTIKAIPMYNIDESRHKFHPPGRGNGYVVTLGNKRIYVSGDTEDIPEMRSLKEIDVAFVCMNLPYTMTEEAAASAVIEFNPKCVIPFHYRGAQNQMSDIKKFKSLVNDSRPEIKVILLNWYP